jgi:hypothetical protein
MGLTMREVKQLFGIGSMSQGVNLNNLHFFPSLFPPAAHFFLTFLSTLFVLWLGLAEAGLGSG